TCGTSRKRSAICPAEPASCGAEKRPVPWRRLVLPLPRSVLVSIPDASSGPLHKQRSGNITTSRQSQWENDAAPVTKGYATATRGTVAVSAACGLASGLVHQHSTPLRSKKARGPLSTNTRFVRTLRCSKKAPCSYFLIVRPTT